VQLETSGVVPTAIGPQGTGVNAAAIVQIRSDLLDGQIRTETSVGGYWTAQQSALQNAQANLGEFLDRNADGLSGTASAGTGAVIGLSDEISSLFSGFQSVATSPVSLTERQALLSQAQNLATRFNQTSQRLTALNSTLNTSVSNDVTAANRLLSDIANLNNQVATAENRGGGTANDLRDLREQKLEELSKLVDISTGLAANGTVTVSIGGVQLVDNQQVLDTLETYDAGGGQLLVRAATAGTPLTITGGSIQGTIDVRDGALATLQSSLDTLASTLITQVNTVHAAGYSLTGSTGANFFTGTGAATMGVNSALAADPSLVQAAGTAGTVGDNTIALALARLAEQPQAALNNQTFTGAYGGIVAALGQTLQGANNQLANHDAVQRMLLRQRDSISGVSIDEEMSDLVRFQTAYEASAKLIATIDEMLETVLSLKR
jgi:flagellar hook-associated protein 1 FlgK